MSKKFIIGLIVIILGLGIWVAVKHSVSKPMVVSKTAVLSSQAPPTPTKQPATQTNVDSSKLPNEFPANIPLEAGAQVTENFNAQNYAGKYQATREFFSAKTLDQNFALYKTALPKIGWTITQTQNTAAPNQRIILATKGADSLNIRIYLDSNNEVRVSINYETVP